MLSDSLRPRVLKTLATVARKVIVIGSGAYAIALIVLLASHRFLSDRWWYALLLNFTPVYFIPAFVLLLLMLMWRVKLVSVLLVALALYAVLNFSQYFIPRQTLMEAMAAKLTILTFNVSMQNSDPASVISWLEAQGADIIHLQEISGAWVANGIPELRKLYPYQIGATLSLEQNSVMILSKYPLRAAQQGASYLRADVVVSAQVFALYNASLPTPLRAQPRQRLYLVHDVLNPLWDMAWGYDESLRNDELDQLLLQVESSALPYIVAGDFNMSEYSSTYGLWSSRMSDSFRLTGSGFGATWPAGKGTTFFTLVRIDYIWHSALFHSVHAEVGSALGSDHLPVYAELQYALSTE